MPQSSQKRKIVAVVGVEIRAGRRGEAAPVGAQAVFELLFAGGVAEVCGRPADVAEIALEVRELRECLCLADNTVGAARGDHAPLMEGQRAEAAPAEAAAVVRDGKAHLLDRGDAAHRLVDLVPGPRVGQLGNGVELRGAERRRRRVHDQRAVAVGLDQRAAADRVVFLVFRALGLGVGVFVRAHLVEGGERDRCEGTVLRRPGQVSSPAHIRDLRDRRPALQPFRDLPRRTLAHAVNQQVRAGVDEDAAAHRVVPVIVVGEAPEARLQSADHDRHVRECLARPVRVDDHGAVGPAAGALSGGVKVLAAAFFRGGVVRDHAVEVAGADQHAELRPSHRGEVVRAVPVRLREHRHAVARRLQHAADHRGAEGRMVHVGVAGDEQEVVPPPAAGDHIVF